MQCETTSRDQKCPGIDRLIRLGFQARYASMLSDRFGSCKWSIDASLDLIVPFVLSLAHPSIARPSRCDIYRHSPTTVLYAH